MTGKEGSSAGAGGAEYDEFGRVLPRISAVEAAVR